MRKITALVACEESQAICVELRRRGWEAYSCDIQDCSGGHPEWHIKGDVLPLIYGRYHEFTTCDKYSHFVNKWDFIMAHPPCTYLANSGSRFLLPKISGEEKAAERKKLQEDAINFFMKFTRSHANFVAIENPLGIMSTKWRKPDQIIQPWMWGDKAIKSTCLWTLNLPKLRPDYTSVPDDMEYVTWIDPRNGKEVKQCKWLYETSRLVGDERRKARSKTFPGIARAIANQWGCYIERELGAR